MRIGVVMRLLARHTATVIMTVTGDVTVSLSTGARFMDLLIDRWTLQLIDSLALVEHRHISISHERAVSGNLATYLRVGVVSSRVEGQKSSRLPGCRKMLENRQRGSNRGVNLIWKLGTVLGGGGKISTARGTFAQDWGYHESGQLKTSSETCSLILYDKLSAGMTSGNYCP